MTEKILGMDDALSAAMSSRGKNIMISAELVIDMANRISELEEAAEDARIEFIEMQERMDD
jgi:hypothetical protein